MTTNNGRGHDLRLEPAAALNASGACVPAAQLVCSCGFIGPAVTDAAVLNHIATAHLTSASRLHAHWRLEGPRHD